MFKWLPFVFSNLRRRPLRVFLTLGSIAIAFLLFGLMEALRTGFAASIDLAGADRLMTLNKISVIQPIPLAYRERVKTVPGVQYVTVNNWFGGVYKNERTQLSMIAVEPESFLSVYPEILLTDKQRADWLADRQGIIVGPVLAQRYGIKTGDRLPIRSAFYRRTDGGDTWEFNVSGIYDVAENGSADKQSMFFHYDYLNEALAPGTRDIVNWMALKISDPANAESIARRVDALFANSSYETATSTEKAFTKRFAEQMGDIGAILIWVSTAVFFTMLLVTANTMAQSVRERTNEIGVLKTLGFGSPRVMGLVLCEALTLTLVGGAIGLVLAFGAVALVGSAIRNYMPIFEIGPGTVVLAVALMLSLGFVSGIWPASQAMRLKITDALGMRQA